MSEGYLFCVGGDELYFKLLTRAISTLREFDTSRPVCVLTDNIELAKTYSPFQNIVYVNFEIHNHIVSTVNPNNTWHKYGFYPKVFQMMYSPFDKTMFFDVDVVFKSDMTFWWDTFNRSDSLCLIAGKADKSNCAPANWHWGWIYKVIQKSGICIPQLSTTFIYYDKLFVKYFVKHIQHILMNLENWGCLEYFCDGYPDEIVFALLLGILEIRPNESMFAWLFDESKFLCCDKKV